LKISCGFFGITILKKLPCRNVYGDGDKRGMLPIIFEQSVRVRIVVKKFKLRTAFINRENELSALRTFLETEPNSILFLYGPKSSGKTTLMYRLFEQIEKEKEYDINFLNLREIFLTSYDDFIDTFFKSTETHNGIRTGTRRQYSLFGMFRLDAFTEKMLKHKKEDPFLVMKQEFLNMQKKGIHPVVIIDEFHKLDGIYMPDKQKRLMLELMNFFVAMTKESHLCHVIIASSDAFFIEQVYVDSKLRKTSKFMKLDYLEKDDVFAWLSDVKQHNGVEEYTLAPEQIGMIWETVGGSAWEIYSILEDMFQRPLDEIIDRIRREKVAMITDWIDSDDHQQRENILKKFSVAPVISQKKLMGLKSILGQAVKDNILCYDPVEGTYGVQGKSLEWGIRGYFEE